MYEEFIGKRMTLDEIREKIIDRDVFLRDIERDVNNAIQAGVVIEICEYEERYGKLPQYRRVYPDCIMFSTYRVDDMILFI